MVMTADTGMRVRARHEGLDVLRVPDEWLRIRGDEGLSSDGTISARGRSDSGV
jgi:hypothetical protein